MKDIHFYYPDSFVRTHQIAELIRNFDPISSSGSIISTAGRVMAKRVMGKIIFFDIQDVFARIQCCADKRTLGRRDFKKLSKQIKIGDIIGVVGKLFITRTGEKTIIIDSFKHLSFCAKNLPEKYHGITDVELRYRRRYLDLIMNPQSRNIFLQRSKLISVLRQYLNNNGFIEVETPILQSNPCGASANPFKTKHDALGLDIYLRISPETYLKQMIVAGFDRVYEIGKSFRNEGIDPSHLQEFTMLEYYVAYWNYEDNMRFIQRMMQEILLDVVGTLQIKYENNVFDFSGEWKVVNYRDLVLKDCGIDVLAYEDPVSLRRAIEDKSIDIGEIPANISLGFLIDRLYKKVSRPKLVQPTFLVHHPAVLLPLARPNDDDPRVANSFQVLVNGWEIIKAYSELADPILQRRLLEEQAKLRDGGDEEAMFLDESFLGALEYGMPPVSGLGLGIDRLVAIITNQKNLRDTILFPLMK